jgi:lysophospholipase L1-like esterase
MEIFKVEEKNAESGKRPGAYAAFPWKTALAMGVVAGALLLWHGKGNPQQGLDPRTLQEAFLLHWPQRPAPPVPTRSDRGNTPRSLPVTQFFVDDGNEMDRFFASLWQMEQAQNGVVTILHYGDSPTTADLITGDIRKQLQEKFGDAGRGYTLIAKPWAWYGHRGVEMSDHGWNSRTGVGLMREGEYGLGGAAFDGEVGAWSKFRMTENVQTAVEVEYLARPDGGSFAVYAGDQLLEEHSTSAGNNSVASVRIALPAAANEISLKVTRGKVTLFGVDFKRGGRGVLYDSLGLNGATTTVLARVQQPELWKQELQHAGARLIVVNYGSNESSFSKYVHTLYAAELRLAIERIRKADPDAAILIMSPMDRGERNGLNDIETMSTIPEVIAIQRQVAAETHCAFFDTYDAMGGNGTMARWFAASPRLVSADLLHPTPQGAAIVASLFVGQIQLRYDRWKMQHGIALPPPPVQTPQKSPAIKIAMNTPSAHTHAGKPGAR